LKGHPQRGGLGRRLSPGGPPRGSQAGVSMGGLPPPRPEGSAHGGPRGEGIPSRDASLPDHHPLIGGYPGGRGGGGHQRGQAPPIPAEGCRVPREGGGGRGVGYSPDWPPTQGGAFLQGLEGGGGGGSAGGWALVSPEEGEGPYNFSRTETLIYPLWMAGFPPLFKYSIVLAWNR